MSSSDSPPILPTKQKNINEDGIENSPESPILTTHRGSQSHQAAHVSATPGSAWHNRSKGDPPILTSAVELPIVGCSPSSSSPGAAGAATGVSPPGGLISPPEMLPPPTDSPGPRGIPEGVDRRSPMESPLAAVGGLFIDDTVDESVVVHGGKVVSQSPSSPPPDEKAPKESSPKSPLSPSARRPVARRPIARKNKEVSGTSDTNANDAVSGTVSGVVDGNNENTKTTRVKTGESKKINSSNDAPVSPVKNLVSRFDRGKNGLVEKNQPEKEKDPNIPKTSQILGPSQIFGPNSPSKIQEHQDPPPSPSSKAILREARQNMGSLMDRISELSNMMTKMEERERIMRGQITQIQSAQTTITASAPLGRTLDPSLSSDSSNEKNNLRIQSLESQLLTMGKELESLRENSKISLEEREQLILKKQDQSLKVLKDVLISEVQTAHKSLADKMSKSG